MKYLAIIALIVANTCLAQDEILVYKGRNPDFHFGYLSSWHIGSHLYDSTTVTINPPPGSPFANCTVEVVPYPKSSGMETTKINQLILETKFSEADWVKLINMPGMRAYGLKYITVDNRPAWFANLEGSSEAFTGTLFITGYAFIAITSGYRWNVACLASGESREASASSLNYWKGAFNIMFNTFTFSN